MGAKGIRGKEGEGLGGSQDLEGLGFGTVLQQDGEESGLALGSGVPQEEVPLGLWGLTLRVQQTCQPQVLLCRAEGSLQVVVGIGLGEFAEVHEIGPRQGHRAGRQQAGSRARGRAGRKTSRPEPHPKPGAGGAPPPEGKAVYAGARLCTYLWL